MKLIVELEHVWKMEQHIDTLKKVEKGKPLNDHDMLNVFDIKWILIGLNESYESMKP